ncbi:hypothetical protein ACFP3I_03300 [Chryseobacterium arachidis]|uniref:hypothetical protein n=1 Tax=Chryseobacterium arachidis TaxID=1416778 RepID=UPI0036140347
MGCIWLFINQLFFNSYDSCLRQNKLKLAVKPESEETILISKNKVAEFKKWLEQ